jgi:hypothetical protein
MSFVLDVFGISESAKAGRKAASAADAAAQDEALQLEARAKATLAAGSFNADRIGKRAKEILAQRRAQAAAGNNDTGGQSEMAVQADTIREASIDQLLTMAQASDDSTKDRYAAELTRKHGKAQAKVMRNQTRANTIVSSANTLNNWAKALGGQ